ncbi:hypothetical protein [Algoriphagus vanfongensis]|uniref:hypothetical protein n=1 Tax=Algoriphagus vanfongensis TaxID=426371 RepID=UPI00040348DC|nr:hypothetical protein [Algoriphagus vanfongensis]
MRNPFKELLENEKLPDLIKTKVMKDINLINLSIDLADLFLVKNPDIIKTILDDELDLRDKKDISPTQKNDPNSTDNE